MQNNELLSAISVMLDEKLDSRFKPIETDIRTMKTDIQSLKTDVQTLKTEMSEVKADVQTLKTEVFTLKTEMSEVKAEVSTLKTSVQKMETEIYVMKEDIHRIKLFQENVILPRLNTIESCYTDTYKRYRTYNERMETAFDDIDMLKIVVAEHSEKLKKIS